MKGVSTRGIMTFVGVVVCMSLFQAALTTIFKIEVEPKPWGQLIYGLSHTLGGVFLTIAWIVVRHKYPKKDTCDTYDDSETGAGVR